MVRESSASRERRGWSLGLGILLVVLGIIAISAPFFATLALALMTGWLLILAGIEQVVFAIQRSEKEGLSTKLLLGAIYIVAGGVLLRRPFVAAVTITMTVGILLIVDGILEIALGIRLRGTAATGWLLTGGILSLILGGITLRGLPQTSMWLIGSFVGIRLVFKGIEHIRLHPTLPSWHEIAWPRGA